MISLVVIFRDNLSHQVLSYANSDYHADDLFNLLHNLFHKFNKLQ